MADKKISELTALTGANVATDDQLVIVDTSAALTKSITIDEFKNALDTATGFVRITGDTMTGNLSMSGANITLGDSSGVSDDRIVLGDDSDLLIYHNNPNSFIRDQGNGNFFITTDGNYIFLAKDDLTSMATFQVDGPVDLYHAGSAKLSTTSTGVDITGTLTSDDVSIADTSPTLLFNRTDRATDNKIIRFAHDGEDFQLQLANDAVSSVTPAIAINRTGMTLDSIAFFEDTGTTAKFFWDASAESLGIGTSSVTSGFKLDVIGDARFSDVAGDDGVELGWSAGGSAGFVQAYDRGASAFRDLSLNNAVTIDSSGNVGIGTSSPLAILQVKTQTNGNAAFQNSTSVTGGVKINAFNDAGNASVPFEIDGSSLQFNIASVEKMRIDSSGNLIVGGTSAGQDGAVTLSNTGYIQARIDNDTVAYFDRTGAGDDGEVIRIQQNGSTVGSIGSFSGGNFYIGTPAGNGSFMLFADNQVSPATSTGAPRDAAIDFGNSSRRFKDLYLSGGVKFDGVTKLQGGAYIIGGSASNGIRFNNSDDSQNNVIMNDDGTTWFRNGIYLGATSNPSSANKLDDYQEGTWTATAVSGISGVSSSTTNNRYTKIGNTVSVIGEMYNFTGQTTDNLEIGGLPYTVGGGYESSCSVLYTNITFDSGYTQLVGYAKAGSAVLRLYEVGNNVVYSALRGNQMGSGSFIFQMTYHTA